MTIAALNESHGGPARTVPALCRAIGACGADVQLITLAERGCAPFLLSDDAVLRCTAVATKADRYRPLRWRADFVKTVRSHLEPGNTVLYDVGLWLPSNHLAARIARETQTPLVASPRGMLSERALQVARLKKRAAWFLYQRRDLATAAALHTTSGAEAEDCRRRGLRQPIAIIPNGVEMPSALPERPQHDSRGKRIALLLSRLHPIKGLLDLVAAWAAVKPNGWRVIIAGPDEAGHRAVVEEAIRAHALDGEFEFTGAVSDADKWALFRRADLFILPSYSESFGQVIAEALAAGLPVITTRATPWADLTSGGCGWWVNTGSEALADAMDEAFAQTSEALAEMGKKGRSMVERKYSWPAAGEKMVSVFDWLLGRGPRPSCVVT